MDSPGANVVWCKGGSTSLRGGSTVAFPSFLDVLDAYRKQVEAQMADLQANLDEVKVH